MHSDTSNQSEGRKDSITEVCFERFLAIWQDSKVPSRSRLWMVFFAGLAVICGAAWLIGAVPTKIYGHDVLIWLAGGWRAIHGQRAHVDFTSPFGPLMFMITGLGLEISHHSADGIGYGSAIVALLVGTWSFFLTKYRLASSPRLILSWFLAALAAAPYPLGLSPFMSSHAMLYNRYGYALFGLILLECFKAARSPKGGQAYEWIGGISTGAALGLTFFLKITFFLVDVVMISGISLLRWRFSRQRILGMILGFSLVSMCMLAYLRFDVAAMLGDFRMAAAPRAGALRSPIGIVLNHASVLLGVMLFCFAAALLFGNRVPQWRGLKLLIIGAFLFVIEVALLMSNAQLSDFPVCAIFAILLVNEVTEDQQALPPPEVHSYRTSYAAVLCLGALLFLPQFTSDLASLAYGVRKKERPSNPEALLRFTSPNLRPLLLYDAPGNPPAEGRLFTAYVNDGVALLERETAPNETILTMDATNPFPYAMERRPPRGGHPAPMYHFNMDDQHRPSDDWYFGDADIVMVPKRASQGDQYYIDFYKAYEPGLKQRYTLAAESDRWWMYRRKH